MLADQGEWHIGHVSENRGGLDDVDNEDGRCIAQAERENANFIATANPKTILALVECVCEVLKSWDCICALQADPSVEKDMRRGIIRRTEQILKEAGIE